MSSTAAAACSDQDRVAAVLARAFNIIPTAHCVQRYLERRNDLLRHMDDTEARRTARRELKKLFRRGFIVDEAPWWVECSRQNPFYLTVGENLVFPLAVLEDGDFLAIPCLDRGAADPQRLRTAARRRRRSSPLLEAVAVEADLVIEDIIAERRARRRAA